MDCCSAHNRPPPSSTSRYTLELQISLLWCVYPFFLSLTLLTVDTMCGPAVVGFVWWGILLHFVTDIFAGTIPPFIATLCGPAVVGFGRWGLTVCNQVICASQRTSIVVNIGCCSCCNWWVAGTAYYPFLSASTFCHWHIWRYHTTLHCHFVRPSGRRLWKVGAYSV